MMAQNKFCLPLATGYLLKLARATDGKREENEEDQLDQQTRSTMNTECMN